MGWFTKKKSCLSGCVNDCDKNCKTYCKQSTTEEVKALKKIEENNAEIDRLKTQETLAIFRANNPEKTPPKSEDHKSKDHKSDTHIYNFGNKGGSRKRTRRRQRGRTRRRVKPRHKGGYIFYPDKPDIRECVNECKQTCGTNCGKICDNASVHTADKKIQKDIKEGEQKIAELNKSILNWNTIYHKKKY